MPYAQLTKQVAPNLPRILDSLEVEAVFQARHPMVVGDSTHCDDEAIIRHVDPLAQVVGRTIDGRFRVAQVAVNHLDLQQPIFTASARGKGGSHDGVDSPALNVVTLDAGHNLAQRLHQRPSLDSPNRRTRKERCTGCVIGSISRLEQQTAISSLPSVRLQEKEVVGRNQRHIVLVWIQRREQRYSGPTTANNDESLLLLLC